MIAALIALQLLITQSLPVTGDANFADESFGSNYLAMRLPRGTAVRICGAGGCWNARTTDYGPVVRTGDVADIAFTKFMHVCGYSRARARQMGECQVRITRRGSGGGSVPTVPPTDLEIWAWPGGGPR